jgi:two-component system LytT family response regulator
MLRAVIIDDEDACIQTLQILALRCKEQIKIVGATSKAEKGIELIEDYQPDIVFLDINMPSMNGFELINRVSSQTFHLVFITAHSEYAIQAIKTKASDYLLKPVSEEDFRNCVLQIANISQKPIVGGHHNPLLEIQVKDGVIFIKQKDIIRLEASRSYTELYLQYGIKHVASKNLGDFELQLDPDIFFRCHKSHIVNLHEVRKFINHEGLFALMSDHSKPDISKSMKELFLQRLKQLST